MKRVYILFVSVFVLVICLGCVNEYHNPTVPPYLSDAMANAEETTAPTGSPDSYSDVTFTSGEYPIEKWGRLQSIIYEGDIVTNKEVAISVAVQLLKGLPDSWQFKNYEPQFLFYDEKDEVWIVCFWEDRGSMVLGGDTITIVIRRSDGAVLSVHREIQ